MSRPHIVSGARVWIVRPPARVPEPATSSCGARISEHPAFTGRAILVTLLPECRPPALVPCLLLSDRMRCKILGTALLCAVIGACGGDDDGDDGSGADASSGADAGAGGGDSGAGDDASAGEFPLHIISAWCGPADGPAVRIALGEADAEEPCAVSQDAPQVLLDVWTRDIEAPMTISFAPTEQNGNGALCPEGTASCRTFPAGDVTFESYADGESARGSWRLLDDEEMVTGDFQATWCEPAIPPPCG